MLKTILKRILQSIPTLFIVITITFVLTRMIPGNPALTMLGPQAPKESVEQLEQELGLDKSKERTVYHISETDPFRRFRTLLFL